MNIPDMRQRKPITDLERFLVFVDNIDHDFNCTSIQKEDWGNKHAIIITQDTSFDETKNLCFTFFKDGRLRCFDFTTGLKRFVPRKSLWRKLKESYWK